MKEFGFLNASGEAIMLNEQIDVVTNADASGRYLVANSELLDADVVAPEINFYLRNSEDSALEKAKGALALYEARATCFDLAKDVDYQKKVGKNVIIVSNGGRGELAKELKEQGYKVAEFSHFEIKFVYGAVGELTAIILRENDEFELDCDFFLVENARDYMLKQSGCIEIAGKTDAQILDFLNSHTPNYDYKSLIHYDSSICQYHERRHEICGKCADACPTVAILKEDATKHLVFSHVDCIDCGECVSVCPSGALDYSPMPRDAFAQTAKIYRGKIALVMPKISDFEGLNLSLPAGVLPFYIEAYGVLSHVHLLTLLQETGANVVLYAPKRAKATAAAVDLLNQIYEAKFRAPAVLVAKNQDELKSALSKAKFIEGSAFEVSEYALPKREIFAKRLQKLVGSENLGVVFADGAIEYGEVSINRDTCTLCLSCVGACNVSALIADKKDNSIKFNPSVCTACGYCELSCAEKDTIKFTRGKIALAPEFFEYKELARDELFKCVECGKEFATKKAVEKIASLMAPKFAGQPEKIKTLYCCADCKAKTMIRAQIAAQNEGKFYE